jgi:DNA polymerase IIIc chi subunit
MNVPSFVFRVGIMETTYDVTARPTYGPTSNAPNITFEAHDDVRGKPLDRLWTILDEAWIEHCGAIKTPEETAILASLRHKPDIAGNKVEKFDCFSIIQSNDELALFTTQTHEIHFCDQLIVGDYGLTIANEHDDWEFRIPIYNTWAFVIVTVHFGEKGLEMRIAKAKCPQPLPPNFWKIVEMAMRVSWWEDHVPPQLDDPELYQILHFVNGTRLEDAQSALYELDPLPLEVPEEQLYRNMDLFTYIDLEVPLPAIQMEPFSFVITKEGIPHILTISVRYDVGQVIINYNGHYNEIEQEIASGAFIKHFTPSIDVRTVSLDEGHPEYDTFFFGANIYADKQIWTTTKGPINQGDTLIIQGFSTVLGEPRGQLISPIWNGQTMSLWFSPLVWGERNVEITIPFIFRDPSQWQIMHEMFIKHNNLQEETEGEHDRLTCDYAGSSSAIYNSTFGIKDGDFLHIAGQIIPLTLSTEIDLDGGSGHEYQVSVTYSGTQLNVQIITNYEDVNDYLWPLFDSAYIIHKT